MSYKIIIFDGSYKTTAFINRLAKGLSRENEVFILGFNEELSHKLGQVHYVPLGSNQNKFRFMIVSLNYALQMGSVKVVLSTIKKLIRGKKRELHKQNLRLVLKKIRPDVIHLQWPSVISFFQEALSNQSIPVILSQRGFHNNVRPFVDENNFSYLQKWYPKMAGFHSVSRSISMNGDKIWSNSKKIDMVVYTGLSLDNFHFSEKYTISNPLELLSIGRAHWIKGYEYTLHMCSILKTKGLSFNYTIIGGSGNEELQFLVADYGLQDCVSLIDRIPQMEVWKRMGEASLLVMPSVEEGVPNVVVEAMALGLPVLSSDCGGVSELIEDGVEGWVVPIRDSEAMADKILDILKLPLEKIEEIRLAARKKVETQHSEDRMVTEMESLYEEVLSKFKKQRNGQD